MHFQTLINLKTDTNRKKEKYNVNKLILKTSNFRENTDDGASAKVITSKETNTN
jgi:hypothetical protein